MTMSRTWVFARLPRTQREMRANILFEKTGSDDWITKNKTKELSECALLTPLPYIAADAKILVISS